MEMKNLKRSILILTIVMGVYNVVVLNIAYFLDQGLPNITYTMIGLFYLFLGYGVLGDQEILKKIAKWIHYFFMAFIITDIAVNFLQPDVSLPVLDWASRAIAVTLLALIWIHLQKLFEDEELT